MSFINRPDRSRFDTVRGEDSPLDAAASAVEGETLAMVAEALRLRRVRLAFQPAVYADDPSLIGFYEGFVRLMDAKDRVIPARDFMDVAETRALGREIDVAALQLGLVALQRNPGIRIAINLSARSVGYGDWTKTLRGALRKSPDLARHLVLEINEASAMHVPDVLLPFMTEMRAAGITFALDDFCAGMTSLPLLRDFRFEIAKIDGRFVRNIDSRPGQQMVVHAALALAEEMGMFVVAEAVETEAEACWLRQSGVGCLQGYLFGAPTIAPDFTAFQKGREGVGSRS